MLTIYTGDYKTIKETIQSSSNLPLLYSTNILKDLKFNTGLFTKPAVYYFLYFADQFKTKEEIKLLLKYSNKINVLCIYETIDKRSIFYKELKQCIKEIKASKQSKSLLDHYKIDKSEKEKYIKGLSVKNDYDYRIVTKMLSANNLKYFADIPASKIITVLYNVYYIRSKNKVLAGKLINEVMQGKMTADIAIKYFLLYYIR